MLSTSTPSFSTYELENGIKIKIRNPCREHVNVTIEHIPLISKEYIFKWCNDCRRCIK